MRQCQNVKHPSSQENACHQVGLPEETRTASDICRADPTQVNIRWPSAGGSPRMLFQSQCLQSNSGRNATHRPAEMPLAPQGWPRQLSISLLLRELIVIVLLPRWVGFGSRAELPRPYWSATHLRSGEERSCRADTTGTVLHGFSAREPHRGGPPLLRRPFRARNHIAVKTAACQTAGLRPHSPGSCRRQRTAGLLAVGRSRFAVIVP